MIKIQRKVCIYVFMGKFCIVYIYDICTHLLYLLNIEINN